MRAAREEAHQLERVLWVKPAHVSCAGKGEGARYLAVRALNKELVPRPPPSNFPIYLTTCQDLHCTECRSRGGTRAADIDLEDSIEKLIAQLENELDSIEINHPKTAQNNSLEEQNNSLEMQNNPYLCNSTSNSGNSPVTNMNSAAPFTSTPLSDFRILSGNTDIHSFNQTQKEKCSERKEALEARDNMMTSRDNVTKSRDNMMTSRDNVTKSRDNVMKCTQKKAELFPIPRTNLFVFNGKVETLQNVINILYSPAENFGNSLKNSLNVSSGEASTRHVTTSVHKHGLCKTSDHPKEQAATAQALQTFPSSPVHTYIDSSEVPTRRSCEFTTSRDSVITSRDSVTTSRDSVKTSTLSDGQYENLVRFLDELKIVPGQESKFFP